MKKVLLTAVTALASLAASATSYVIYSGDALKDDEVLIPANYYLWEGTYTAEDVDDPTSPDGRAHVLTLGSAGWFGGGWETDPSFDITQLIATDASLVFYAKAEAPFNTQIQFNNTSKNVQLQPDYTFEHDGQWHEVRMNLREWFPNVVASMEAGDKLYAFTMVGNTFNPGDKLWLTDIHFEEGGEIVEPVYEYGGVWYGNADFTISYNGKDIPVSVDYDITANANGTLTMNAAFEGTEGIDGLVYQLHTAGQWPTFTATENGYTVTSPNTFSLGQQVSELFFWLPYTGGVARHDISYFFGAVNEAPAKVLVPRITASAENISAFAADIVYNVILPAELEGADVTVYCNEAAATASPIALGNLEPNTAYTYTLYAVASLNGETYESKPVEVSFRTLRDGATAAVWHTIADGMIANAYLPGEDPATARRSIPVSIETTVTYNVDGTITVDAVFHGGNVVGLVPQITVSSNDYKFEYKPMLFADGKYTITTDTEYPVEHNIGWLYFFLAYDGGSSTINVNGYTTGMENDGAAYGDAAAIDLSISRTSFSVGQTAIVSAIIKDAAGHYLLDNEADVTVEGNAFTIDGAILTATAQGAGTVVATYGENRAEATVKCATTAEAKRLFGTYEADHNNPELAFDDNEGTQIEWSCAETEAHTLSVDLGKTMSIQAIELVWEGASASEYTVAITDDSSAARIVSHDAKTFTVTEGEGGAGVTIRELLHTADFSAIEGRYVTLNTSKAYVSAWGIKLKEMHIMGTDRKTTTLILAPESADETEAEYFNLQGVRVENPSAGLYIRRQGNSVVKVMVK